MRRGVPMAGNHLMQELVLVTGALEAMVVDYQCIMPSIVDVAKCYHTKIISTADKAKFAGATHVSFDPAHGAEIARRIVRMAVEAYPDRNPERVRIPSEPVQMMGGFSVEAILGALGGTPKPLVDAIAAGTIRGAVAVVGCNNPKLPQDLEHIELTRRLIENDILVVVTGCAAVANGKAGQMVPEAAGMAGPGLRSVCEALGIPPVLHMGSCVDNSRIMVLAAALADYLGVDIDQLPLAGAAPEWYSEKAVAIGAYVVGSGITTVLGVQPAIFGSSNVVGLLAGGLDDVVGAKFVGRTRPGRRRAVDPTPPRGQARSPRPAVPHHSRDHRRDHRHAGRDRRHAGRRRDGGLRAVCETCGGHGSPGAGPAPTPGAGRAWPWWARAGSGKSTLTALMARQLARRGVRVVAVDADEQRNLAATLGLRRRDGGTHRGGGRRGGLHRGEDGARPGGGCGRPPAAQSRHHRPGRPAVGRRARRGAPGGHGRRAAGGRGLPVPRDGPRQPRRWPACTSTTTTW